MFKFLITKKGSASLLRLLVVCHLFFIDSVINTTAQNTSRPRTYVSSRDSLLTNNLGQESLRIGDCEQAIIYYKKLAAAIDTTSEEHLENANVLNYLGTAHFCNNDSEMALKYFLQALSLRLKTTDSMAIANSYSNVGLAHSSMNDHSKALTFHNKSLELFSLKFSKHGIANELNNIGEIHYYLGNTDLAEDFFYRSIQLANELNSADIMLDNKFDLARNFAAKKEFEKAFNESQYSYLLLDSLSKRDALVYARALSNYETAEKDLENKFLETQNKLDQEKTKSLEYRDYIIMSSLLFFVILMLIVFLGYRKRKSQETTVMLKELELLRAQTIIHNRADEFEEPEKLAIHKQVIDNYSEGKLNPSDWKTLEIIYINPTITNNELALAVHLSESGLRSSIKKMYRLFHIDKPSSNKRLSLVIKITTIINEQNS